MAWLLPTYDELRIAVIGLIKGRRPTASTAPGSDADILSATLAHLAYGLHLSLKAVIRALIPTEASEPYIDAWAWLFGLSNGSGGYGRIIARGSSGTVTVTATGATADLQGQEFTDDAGRRYQITESHAFAGAGTYVFDVAAITTGLATNLEVSAAPVLTWAATPVNVTTIVIATDFDGGADRETDAALRARLAEFLQLPPQSGNAADFERWIEDASPGAIDAHVWYQRNGYPYGLGTVDYMILQRGEVGADREASAAQSALVAAAILAGAPTRLGLTVREVDPDWQPARVAVTIDVLAGYEPDCPLLAALNVYVDDSDEANLKITADGDVSSAVAAGDRVIINGVQGVVASVSTIYITFESWPWPAGTGPINGHRIYSGGGPVLEYATAIIDHLNSLGPARDAATGADQAGAPVQWEDSIRSWRVKSLAKDIAGIYNVEVDDICGGGDVDAEPAPGTGATAEIYGDDGTVDSEVVVLVTA